MASSRQIPLSTPAPSAETTAPHRGSTPPTTEAPPTSSAPSGSQAPAVGGTSNAPAAPAASSKSISMRLTCCR
ncbi:unnamed protein product [Linum trigynum]|uniref:Uncharacterized protein n=1 Tax=Linum trigynum TaxID=586398 RepID=A0AAV2FDR4_9ROSI